MDASSANLPSSDTMRMGRRRMRSAITPAKNPMTMLGRDSQRDEHAHLKRRRTQDQDSNELQRPHKSAEVRHRAAYPELGEVRILPQPAKPPLLLCTLSLGERVRVTSPPSCLSGSPMSDFAQYGLQYDRRHSLVQRLVVIAALRRLYAPRTPALARALVDDLQASRSKAPR